MTKTRRQTVILELLDHEQVTSQEILQRRLKTRGIHATQATISRDLKELGLVKRAGDGAYGRPGQDTTSPENALAHLQRVVVRSLSRTARAAGAAAVKEARWSASCWHTPGGWTHRSPFHGWPSGMAPRSLRSRWT